MLGTLSPANRRVNHRTYRAWTQFAAQREFDVMIQPLVYAGSRRSDLIALRRSDINFEDITIAARHGKGDKERMVAIVDPSEGTVRALRTLRSAQGDNYTRVFPSMTRGRKATWAADAVRGVIGLTSASH